jgi:hypothetical protein
METCRGAMMYIDELLGKWEHPRRADKSAVGAINRPLQITRKDTGGEWGVLLVALAPHPRGTR